MYIYTHVSVCVSVRARVCVSVSGFIAAAGAVVPAVLLRLNYIQKQFDFDRDP